MTTADSCDQLGHTVDGRTSEPIPFGFEPHFESHGSEDWCHDCGVGVGGFHHVDCDTEWCPVEDRQVLGCDRCPEREAWWEGPGHQYRMAKARFLEGASDDQLLATYVRTVLRDPGASPAARRLAREEIAGIDFRAEFLGGPKEDWSDLPR